MKIIIQLSPESDLLLSGEKNADRRRRLASHVSDEVAPILDEWCGLDIEDVTVTE